MKQSPRFKQALRYAATVHRGQVRKGTSIPYLSHLEAAAEIVIEHGGSEDQAIAALLHDALEDQPMRTSYAEVRDRFGEAVAQIVRDCTDSETVPKPPWRERKEVYLAHLREASPAARLVSAADKLHNATSILNDYRALGNAVWSRFNPSRDEILWYYGELLEVFRDRVPKPLWDKLERTVSELRGAVQTRPAPPRS